MEDSELEDEHGSMGDEGNNKDVKTTSKGNAKDNSSNVHDASNPLKFDDELQVKLDELRPKDACENKGDFVLGDMGTCLPLKSDTVDGVISVSAIQWLC